MTKELIPKGDPLAVQDRRPRPQASTCRAFGNFRLERGHYKFVDYARDQAFLLPPDLRDWVPEDDIVHFVIEAVERMPSTPNSFAINLRGTGSQQYSPRMMLALLVYCYANGIFSSRRIERATYRDVGVRYLTGEPHPDHDTIARFDAGTRRLSPRLFCMF